MSSASSAASSSASACSISPLRNTGTRPWPGCGRRTFFSASARAWSSGSSSPCPAVCAVSSAAAARPPWARPPRPRWSPRSCGSSSPTVCSPCSPTSSASEAGGIATDMADTAPPIVVEDLTMAFGSFVLQRDLSFTVARGDIFIIMGGSGCGKSTLLRHMIGLKSPAKGKVYYSGVSLWDVPVEQQRRILQGTGVLFQRGALWSSMTLAENIALPLSEYTRLTAAEIRSIASLKLALVGLAGFEEYYPSEISGGMQKRAGLARAMALDPEILFFDEPSAGLDPISSKLLDDLIVELRDSVGATVVIVTHELASIFTIATNSLFLDVEQRTMTAGGDPKELLAHPPNPMVHRFLTRGEGEQI